MRRELTKEDMIRMRIPKRYWFVRFEDISDKGNKSARGFVKKYLDRITKMSKRGIGLCIWGRNGVGKTCVAVVIGREFRRTGKTVLFMSAAGLKRAVAGREWFDVGQTLWERAISVDLLILDDLGKGIVDSKGFGKRTLDELLRIRNGERLVTIITTNVKLSDAEQASEILQKSTIHSLKEHVVPLKMIGEDRRESKKNDNMEAIIS